MPTEIRLPRIGHSMTEATIVAWHVKAGDTVKSGQPIVTIETDKAEYEVEAPADGVLSEPAVRETDVAAVGALLGWIVAPGEAAPETGREPGTPPAHASSRRAPSSDTGGRVRASPKARRLAAERGVDLAAIAGSGPEGLVTESDVERAATEPERRRAATGTDRRVRERRRLAPLRRTTARRMTEAWTTTPHIVQMIDADMTEVGLRRRDWKAAGDERALVTWNDFIVKASALALREHPDLNAAVEGDELVLFDDVNAGVAVDTPRGLVVPVIREADRLPLGELAKESRRLAAKARERGLEADDFGTGTFTVSNLGAFGIRAGTPVLNPPESVLVFVGAVGERAVVRDGSIVARTIVTLSIAYDHRVADGAAAARLTARIRELLEDPDSLGTVD